MLENYIKLAWKVLLRRKFFTFVSLFGISFTIFVLLIATSILDHAISPGGPEINKSRILYADRLMAHDSINSSIWMSSPGYKLLDKYARTMKTPELVSISSEISSYFTYVDERKINFTYKYTDDVFWKIYKFNFIDGKPFDSNDYEDANFVAVVSEYAAEKYFGDADVIGKSIDVAGSPYRIIGVVENVSEIRDMVYSDIWVPITTLKEDYKNQFVGRFRFSALAYSVDDFDEIRNEWHSALRASIADMPSKFSSSTVLKCLLKSNEDRVTALLFEQEEDIKTQTTSDERIVYSSGMSSYITFYLAIGGLMLLFMLLPSINLVNINLSRMVERNSEIGVRKAFGATRKILVGQFITENIILTFIGGIISLILTFAAIYIINDSGVLVHAKLNLNLTVFLFGFVTCIILGIISGVYPAYRMSKTHPVEALRGGVK